jgi:Zn-dependent peptidase ImmA (M78 family)
LAARSRASRSEKETGQLPQLPPEYPEPRGGSKTPSALIEDAEHIAESEWRRLGLGDEPMKDIFSLIESQCVHVIRQDMGANAFDGAFLYSRENGAFIIINSSRPISRQVFTAAHEYCHCLRHRRSGILIDRSTQEIFQQNDRTPVERFAHLFAAAFLMPKRAIEKAVKNFNKHVGPEEAIQLKRYFGVSYQAMVYRLLNLNMIPKARKDEFLKIRPNALEGSIFGVTEETPAPEGLPERYVRLALDAYLMGKVTVSRLAELLNKDIFELKKALADSGLKRQKRS